MKCPKCDFQNPEDTIYCGKCATLLPPLKELTTDSTLNYRRFLDLWRDADPGQPEVEEAKRKLAGLSRIRARMEQNL